MEIYAALTQQLIGNKQMEWCPELRKDHPVNIRRCEVREFLKKRLEQSAVYSRAETCAVSQP